MTILRKRCNILLSSLLYRSAVTISSTKLEIHPNKIFNNKIFLSFLLRLRLLNVYTTTTQLCAGIHSFTPSKTAIIQV